MFIDNRDFDQGVNFSNVDFEDADEFAYDEADRNTSHDCSTCSHGRTGECTYFNQGQCGMKNNFALWSE